jgi:hypothetical protein
MPCQVSFEEKEVNRLKENGVEGVGKPEKR